LHHFGEKDTDGAVCDHEKSFLDALRDKSLHQLAIGDRLHDTSDRYFVVPE
jgi:hypothetical protein